MQHNNWQRSMNFLYGQLSYNRGGALKDRRAPKAIYSPSYLGYTSPVRYEQQAMGT